MKTIVVLLIIPLLLSACSEPAKPEDNRGLAMIRVESQWAEYRAARDDLRERLPAWTVVCDKQGRYGFTGPTNGFLIASHFSSHQMAEREMMRLKAIHDSLGRNTRIGQMVLEVRDEARFSPCK
jgi:hypothetical protein